MHDFLCGFSAVFRRDLMSAVHSYFLYIVAAVFMVCTSCAFFVFGGFFIHGEARVDTLFPILQVMCCIFIPFLTMRIWIAEKVKQADLILLTLPITELSVVLGKFAAVEVQVSGMLLLSAAVPAAVSVFGEFDVGFISCGYLGIFLLCSAAVSAAMFFSCLCGKQAVSVVCSFFFLAAGMVAHIVLRVADVPVFIAKFLTVISFENHLASFFRGIIDSRDCAFFVLIAVFFLLASRWLIVFRRWR